MDNISGIGRKILTLIYIMYTMLFVSVCLSARSGVRGNLARLSGDIPSAV